MNMLDPEFKKMLQKLKTLTTIVVPSILSENEIAETEFSMDSVPEAPNYEEVYQKIVGLEGTDFDTREFKKNYFYSQLQFDQFINLRKELFDVWISNKSPKFSSEQQKKRYSMHSCIAPIYLFISKAIKFVINSNKIEESDLKFLNRVIETRNKLIQHNSNPLGLNLIIELDEHTSIGTDKEVWCDIIDSKNEDNVAIGYLYPEYDFKQSSKIISVFIEKLNNKR